MHGGHEMTEETKGKAGPFQIVRWKSGRFVQLFVFIVLFVFFSPMLSRTPFLAVLGAFFFLNIIAVTLSSAGVSRRRLWLVLLVWLAGTLLDVASQWMGDPRAGQFLAAASELVKGVLLVICVVLILRYVLRSCEVTVDTIFGAFVAYFLIAFTFSSLYQALVIMEPASFSIPVRSGGGAGASPSFDLAYFSFVTIATLGYGDIVPKLPVTQMLSILEAVTGQFFMAVVVAWLVSVLAGSRRRSGGKGADGQG